MSKVKDTDKGYRKALAGVRAVRDVFAVVGIRQAKGSVKERRTGSRGSRGGMGTRRRAPGQDDDLTLAEIAAVHEYGDREGRIPERSYLRHAFDANRDSYQTILDNGVRIAVDEIVKGADPTKAFRKALGILATESVGDTQERIADGPFTPNADATIAAKGSTVPLIDTGHLRQSIDYGFVPKRPPLKVIT